LKTFPTNAVSVEAEKSDEVLAEQVQKAPQTGPNGNVSGAKSGSGYDDEVNQMPSPSNLDYSDMIHIAA
jgi:hypothetical protein